MDTAETAPVEEHRFPCPACGSDLRYGPDTGGMVCDHCGHQEEIASASPWGGSQALAELDYDAAVAGALPEQLMEITRVVHCDSCGADIELGTTGQAAECPFCASPIVTDTGEHRHIKPKALLPFAVDEDAAQSSMTKWLGRLWFAPNGLQEYARKGRRMQGIYVPYWTYDARTRSAYHGQRGDNYWTTETRVVNGESQQVRVQKVRWRAVRGNVARDFDDVLALASRSLPESYTDALEPWDLEALKPYQPEYLAGFRAEGYQVPLQEGFGIARTKMDKVIRQDVRRDIGGDHQRIAHVATDVRDVTFKHVLLPVWLAAYKFRDTTYRFVVNARTGEVKGERPWSPVKIAIAVVLALLVIGGGLYLAEVSGQL